MELQEKTNILLVDDRQENLISLSAILDSPEYNLVMASSGQQGLRCLLEQDFALILLDVQMPLMDGFETASLIKKREKSKSIPIIFITALSPEAPFLFRGYSAGAVDYISKPFEPNILRSKVAVFAELNRKTRQLELQSKLLRDHEKLEREQAIARIELSSLRREQTANEKYRDLVEGIKDGVVWTADLSTSRFSFVSTQADRLLSIALFEKAILDAPDFKQFRKNAMRALRKGAITERDFRFEHQVQKPDKSTIWLKTSVRLADKEETGEHELRGLSVDVTEIKKAQEEAQAAINIRDQFLSIASHELKTPLTPLCLQIGILQKMAKDNLSQSELRQKLDQCLERFSRHTDRLNHLINELLDISRINNGKLLLEKETVRLSEIIKEVCERVNVNISRAGSTVSLTLDSKIEGQWDKLRIEQVVTNLLVNALKYGDGKPIEIVTKKAGNTAILQVRDNGIGIKKEDQGRIFNLYERAVSPMHFGGLGLGLYIVNQIVEAHGGTIAVESSLSAGSIFTIALPLANNRTQDVRSTNTVSKQTLTTDNTQSLGDPA